MTRGRLSGRDFMRLGASVAALGAAAKMTVLERRKLCASPPPVPPSGTVMAE
jgi:hypothetical protein